MTGAICWRWATKRPVSGMAFRIVFNLATGNTLVYLVQRVFADLTVAAVFLGSLWTARPAIARLAPDFSPVDDALAARPGMRALFRRLTLMWGLAILVRAASPSGCW
jgi:hypothetical protein